MFSPDEIPDVEPGLALVLIAIARSIAPCIDTLSFEDQSRKTAAAILNNVAQDAAGGSRVLKSQRIGPAAVEYAVVTSWFSDDHKTALRALCAPPGAVASGPVGSFPLPGRISQLWPERY